MQPNLHDGDLVGLLIKTNSLLVLIKDVSKAVHCFALKDIKTFKADDFRQGNIVFDLEIEPLSQAAPDDIAHAFGATDVAEISKLREQIEKLIADNYNLVRLDTSYGCYFSAICKNVEFGIDYKSELAEI